MHGNAKWSILARAVVLKMWFDTRGRKPLPEVARAKTQFVSDIYSVGVML
jgi:hypothetical protein